MGFKIRYRKVWEFDSPSGHQNKIKGLAPNKR